MIKIILKVCRYKSNHYILVKNSNPKRSICSELCDIGKHYICDDYTVDCINGSYYVHISLYMSVMLKNLLKIIGKSSIELIIIK